MKPTPGKTYTTIGTETLEQISSTAYGDPQKYTLITDVNSSQIKITSSEQLPAGLNLIIPIDTILDGLRQQQLQKGLQGNT